MVTQNKDNQLSIDTLSFQEFLRDFHNGNKYKGLRIGQAFYGAFSLRKMVFDKTLADKIRETENQQSLEHLLNFC